MSTASSLFLSTPSNYHIDVGLGKGSSSTPSTPSTPTTDIVRFYFISQDWWNDAGAVNRMYVWKNSTGTFMKAYPGDLMTKDTSYTGKDGVRYYYDVDVLKYDYALITRWDPKASTSTGNPWNKTVNFQLNKAKRTIYIYFGNQDSFGNYYVSIP